MKGSEKQVAWAQDIIDTCMRNFDNLNSNIDCLVAQGLTLDSAISTRGYSHEDVEAVRAIVKAQCDKVDDARMYIDNRYRFEYDQLLKMVLAHHRTAR